MLNLNLQILEDLTPKYQHLVYHKLNASERKILATMARINTRIRVRNLVSVMPAPKPQHNILSMQLYRLNKTKGILNNNKDGYDFNDVWLRLWFRARAGLF